MPLCFYFYFAGKLASIYGQSVTPQQRKKTLHAYAEKQGRIQGGSRIFIGGAKDNVCAHTSRARSPKFLIRPGSRPHSSLSLIYKHSDTKWDFKNTVDQILGGGGGVLRPPLNPPLESALIINFENCKKKKKKKKKKNTPLYYRFSQ